MAKVYAAFERIGSPWKSNLHNCCGFCVFTDVLFPP
jgi:hypothetical protein